MLVPFLPLRLPLGKSPGATSQYYCAPNPLDAALRESIMLGVYSECFASKYAEFKRLLAASRRAAVHPRTSEKQAAGRPSSLTHGSADAHLKLWF